MKVNVTIFMAENEGDKLALVYNVLDVYEKKYVVRGKAPKRRIEIKKVEADLLCDLVKTDATLGF